MTREEMLVFARRGYFRFHAVSRLFTNLRITCICGNLNEQTQNFDQAFVGMYAAMCRKGDLGFPGLRCLRDAESVNALLRERRTYGRVRSVTSKRWIPAIQRTSSRGDPMRAERVMAVLVHVCLHAISTMPPSCARCAPTGSNASLVHHYGLPTAWGAPACLHAAACADRNRVTLSPQLSDRSARAPQLLHSGLYMVMDQCRSLEGGPQAVRGDIFQKVDVRTPCPTPCGRRLYGVTTCKHPSCWLLDEREMCGRIFGTTRCHATRRGRSPDGGL
jgi:hypothetical protein